MSVFHLKYRPKKIADLDLVEVRQTLSKIFSQEEKPQSFLFCGPKGAGKTSAARIVAKIVNCKNVKNSEACGKCENCKLIDGNGSVLDIMEMDGASNRGIDDIRLLKEKIFLSPVNLSSKVFVIDEVHMLTKEAFNALLKILEEPPKNVYFVLCTTNPEKIPETVLSRLVRVDFRKGSIAEVVTSLTKVIEGEDIKIVGEKEVLVQIASLSEGSFRNGQRILMELVMDKGKKISEKDWQDFCAKKFSVGGYGGEMLEQDLKAGRTKEILEQLEGLVESGVDMVMYRQRLIEYFQKKLVNYYSNKQEAVLDIIQLGSLLRLLIQAGKEEKEAVLEQLPLQLVMVDFGTEYGESGDEGGEKKENKLANQIPSEQMQPRSGGAVSARTKIEVKKTGRSMDYGFGLEDIIKSWKDLLVAVRPYNHSVEAFLRSARPLRIEGNKLIVEVFYKFHKDRLEDDRNRKIVEAGLAKIFSAPLLFVCELAQKGSTTAVFEKEKRGDELYDVAKEIFGD